MANGRGRRRAAIWTGVLVGPAALLGACIPPDPGAPTTTAAPPSSTPTTASTTTAPTTTVPEPAACDTVTEVPLGDGQGRNASVSADGVFVAFVLGSTIQVKNTVSGAEFRVGSTLPTAQSYSHVKISADGTRVGVVGQSSGSTARRAWIIDIRNGIDTELDWSGVDWPNFTYARGFSDDLSAFVTWRSGTDQVRIIPSDGSPIRVVTIPSSGYAQAYLDDDASTISDGLVVWRDGQVLTYPGTAGPFTWVVDVNRAGDRALMSSESGTFIWDLDDDGLVQVGPGPGETSADTGWAQMSEDGRFVVRSATVVSGGQEPEYVSWRVDRATGTWTPLPSSFDGITGISDDGRVMTSTSSQIFVCS
jgi:hypothetical protein